MNAGALHPPNPATDPCDGDDLAWAEAAAAGDRRAFERIYRRHAARVYGLSLRLTRDEGEAERLTQDTFVKAWFALAGFRGQGSLGAWLARVATNLWRDRYRSRQRREQLVSDAAVLRGDREGQEPTAGLSGHVRSRPDGVVPLLTAMDLERCVARLPAGARQVYVLHDIEELKHREIADLLGVAVGTVKAQLHRARRLLRVMLEADEAPAEGKRGRS